MRKGEAVELMKPHKPDREVGIIYTHTHTLEGGLVAVCVCVVIVVKRLVNVFQMKEKRLTDQLPDDTKCKNRSLF